MEALSKGEAARWCEAQGARLDKHGFPSPGATPDAFNIPVDAGQRVALAARCVDPFRALPETLVWFHDWAVWPSGQRMHIFERFLASYGEARPLSERPAFLLSSAEYEDCLSLATIGVLFLWDVYLVGTKAKHLLHFSHDEHGWAA